jgi:two-component system, NarL family, sensor histidine kinase BarA
MSYRAFKKLLGETSLERKCRFVLGTVSLVLITGSFWFYAWMTEKIAYKSATRSGPLLIGRTLFSLHDDGSDASDALNQFQLEAEKKWPKAISKYSYNVIKPFVRTPTNQPDPLVPDEASLID